MLGARTYLGEATALENKIKEFNSKTRARAHSLGSCSPKIQSLVASSQVATLLFTDRLIGRKASPCKLFFDTFAQARYIPRIEFQVAGDTGF